MTQCSYKHRSGAQCKKETTQMVERPTNDGHVSRPDTCVMGYCDKHAPEILKLVGGRIV